jgi:hypothetical protein
LLLIETLSEKDIELIRWEINFSINLRNKIFFKIMLMIGIMLIILSTIKVLFLNGDLHQELRYILFPLLVMPYLFFMLFYSTILKQLDLKKGKKIVVHTTDYAIKKKKDQYFIQVNESPKQQIEIDDYFVDFIEIWRPLKIEILPKSKSLLFISHNQINLIEDIVEENEII